MRAATFNWLNTVDDLEINGSVLRFTLSSTNNYNELEQITAEGSTRYKYSWSIRQLKPWKRFSILKFHKLKHAFAVYDMDNVHAIEGQPFELTADQYRFLNEYLDEMVA